MDIFRHMVFPPQLNCYWINSFFIWSFFCLAVSQTGHPLVINCYELFYHCINCIIGIVKTGKSGQPIGWFISACNWSGDKAAWLPCHATDNAVDRRDYLSPLARRGASQSANANRRPRRQPHPAYALLPRLAATGHEAKKRPSYGVIPFTLTSRSLCKMCASLKLVGLAISLPLSLILGGCGKSPLTPTAKKTQDNNTNIMVENALNDQRAKLGLRVIGPHWVLYRSMPSQRRLENSCGRLSRENSV